MDLVIEDLAQAIRSAKRQLRAGVPGLERAFRAIETEMRREVDDVAAIDFAAIPVIGYSDIRASAVSAPEIAAIKRRGAVVVRRTFPKSQAEDWNERLGEYIERNGYFDQKADSSADRYFSSLKSDRPQIFGIYWSRPQIEARQSQAMADTRRFLNRLWLSQQDGALQFDPDRECTYADRIRRREPGDMSFGLSPHMDGGSVERWIDAGFRRVFRHVFAGDLDAFDPFDGAHRTGVNEIPSPAVCSVFRTFQGWTALTDQGPGDGTLKLLPISRAIAYLLLRPLLEDVPEDSLCGAAPGRALSITPEWHGLLMPALVSIPMVEAGDTVWWHPDLIHAVEDRHRGKGYSSVMYIGAAPYCAKNAAFLERQKAAFLKGESCPDFAPENYEVAYEGRATLEDLTDLGRRQMGFTPW